MRHGFHGDVIFKEIKELPKGLKSVKRKERGFVLAEGEVTGHAHVITEDVELYEKGGVLYLKNDTAVSVVHEEHKKTTIPAGIWEIGIVREYDFLSEEVRNVAD